MNLETAVELYRKKFGNHTHAACALGWDPRKYRDVRNARKETSDAARLLIAKAEADFAGVTQDNDPE